MEIWWGGREEGEGGRSVDVLTRDSSTLPGPLDTQQLPESTFTLRYAV